MCHSCATRGPPVALPRGLSATSHPPVVPRAMSPSRHVTASPRQLTGPVDQNTPLFRDFKKEINQKNTLKIQIKIEKRAKTSENHILKYTTPF